MSGMSNPNALNIAVAEASTNNDVIAAIASDPDLKAAVAAAFTGLLKGDKSILESKTFWAAIVVPVVASLAGHYAAGLDAGTIGEIDTVLEALAMIAMRFFVTKPVTSVLTVAKS